MELLREKLLLLEETIEVLEIKIARKEKWIRSGLLMKHKDLEQRFAAEAEQLKKERIIALDNIFAPSCSKCVQPAVLFESILKKKDLPKISN